MPKPRSSDTKLARLRELRNESSSPQRVEELRAALRDVSNFVVADAAEIAGSEQIAELADALSAAFERFTHDPIKTDKLCRAKITIVEALNKIECDDEAFYLHGVKLMQMEPVWGGSVDAAIPVRVACAFGLVRIRHRGVMPLLVDMLARDEKGERAGAAQALAYSGTDAAGLLLRLKVRVGDLEPEVISECFDGILELSGAAAIPFVAEYLSSSDEAIQEAALLALGSSRKPEAFEILKSFAEDRPAPLRSIALTAIALLRQSAATDYLVELIGSSTSTTAIAAVEALSIHRFDPKLRERVAAAVQQTNDAKLRSVFEKKFRTDE